MGNTGTGGRAEAFRAVFVCVMIAACIAGGYTVYKLGAESGVYKYAADALRAETNDVLDDNRALERQREQYLETIEESTAGLSEDESENEQLKSYYDRITENENKTKQLDSDIEAAKAERDELAAYESSLGSVSNETAGEPRALTDGTYRCPDDIAAGRYRLTGTGMFRIVINASNRVSDSQDLGSLDGNSYTLNIENDTRLITEGDVTITPVN